MKTKLFFLIPALTLSISTTQAQTGKVMPVEPQQNLEQKQSWLGVELSNVPLPLARQFEHLLVQNQGVMVKKVVPDSPAAKAGITEFDIITLFNNQKIFSAEQLQHLVQASELDSKVSIERIHQGKLETIDVELGSRMVMNHYNYRNQHPRDFGNNPGNWFNNRDRFNQQIDEFFNNFQFPDLNKYFNSTQTNSWSDFNSIQVNRLDGDRYRAEVEFQQNGGDKKEFIFEGKREEISKQIMENQDLPEDKKQSLLNALNMEQGLQLQDFFNQGKDPRHGFTNDPAFRNSVPPWARQYLPPN